MKHRTTRYTPKAGVMVEDVLFNCNFGSLTFGKRLVIRRDGSWVTKSSTVCLEPEPRWEQHKLFRGNDSLLLVNDGFFGINKNLETVEVEWLLGVTSQDIDRWDYRE